MTRPRTQAELDALAKYRAIRKVKADRMRDDLAELLAEGLTIT